MADMVNAAVILSRLANGYDLGKDSLCINFRDYVRCQLAFNVSKDIVHTADTAFFSKLSKALDKPDRGSTSHVIEGVRCFYRTIFSLVGYNLQETNNLDLDLTLKFDGDLLRSFYGLTDKEISWAEVMKYSSLIGQCCDPGGEYSELVSELQIDFNGSRGSALLMLCYMEANRPCPNLIRMVD